MSNNYHFYKYLAECQHPELYCFDTEQYNKKAKTLDVSVWTNFRGQIYSSDDFKIDIHSCCTWHKNKWIIKDYNILILKGLQEITDYLVKNYVDLE